ncbi:MAG: hypothetical protein KatS3mg056_3334 [Chloroflexus sp.]|jgi:hypothetical protein|nr:MAG: hypothetical protein KatS3mg056_3334 [Chloroflexus sp.]
MLHIKNDLGSGVNNSVWVKNTRCARYRASRRRAFPGGRAALALCHHFYAIRFAMSVTFGRNGVQEAREHTFRASR